MPDHSGAKQPKLPKTLHFSSNLKKKMLFVYNPSNIWTPSHRTRRILQFPTLDGPMNASFTRMFIAVSKSIFPLTSPVVTHGLHACCIIGDVARERDCCFCCLLSSQGLLTPSHSRKSFFRQLRFIHGTQEAKDLRGLFFPDPGPEAMKTLTETYCSAEAAQCGFAGQTGDYCS